MSKFYTFRSTLHILTLAAAMAFTSAVQAKNIFVAPSGSDSAAGTMDAPLASLAAAHAKAKAAAGDTIYLRGGTYRIGESQIMSTQENIYACVFDLTRGGTAAGRTVIAGYPGERPVLDLSDVKPEGKRSTSTPTT